MWAEDAISHTAIGVDEFILIKKLPKQLGRDINDYPHFTLR